MSKIFFADCDSDELSHRITKFIEAKSDDNFKTHFKQGFLFFNQFKASGRIEGNTFKIWTGRSAWSGIFYPVVVGHVRQMEHGLQVELKTKMNSLIYWPLIAIAAILLITIILDIILQGNNQFRYLIPRIAIAIFLFALLIAPMIIILRHNEHELIQKVILALDLKKAA